MTRAYLHLRLHKHFVQANENYEFKEKISTFIREQIVRTSKATNSAVVMEDIKELVE